MITVTVFYFAPAILNDCSVKESGTSSIEYKAYLCTGEDEYNPLATLLFNTQSQTIKSMLNDDVYFGTLQLFVFFLIWYIFTITTSGTAAPLGIFLPCIIIGCALGHIYGNIVDELFPSDIDNLHS